MAIASLSFIDPASASSFNPSTGQLWGPLAPSPGTPTRDQTDISAEANAPVPNPIPLASAIRNDWGINPNSAPPPPLNGQDAQHAIGAIFRTQQVVQGVPLIKDGAATPLGQAADTKVGANPGLLAKALGPIGLASSGYAGYQAVQELRQGNKIDGGFDLAQASAGATSSAGFIGSLAAKGGAATALGTVGGVAGGGLAVVDGAQSLYHGVKDGNTEQSVEGGVKVAAGGLMIAGAVTGDPILVGAGGLLYGGDKLYENRKEIGDLAKKGASWVGTEAPKAAQGVQHAAQAVGGGVQHAAEAVGGGVQHAAQAVGGGVQHAAQAVGGGVQHAAEAVGGGVQHAAQAVGGGVQHAAQAVGNAASGAFHSLASFF